MEKFYQFIDSSLPDDSGNKLLYKFKRKTMDEMTYTKNGDYFIPNLSYPETKATYGKYGVMRENYLKNHPEPEEIEYYLCGPPMMTQAVLNMLDNRGVPKEMIMFDDFGS